MSIILTARCTVDDVDNVSSASRFCVRTIEIVMSDSVQHYLLHVSCFSFGNSKVLFKIQHLRRLT